MDYLSQPIFAITLGDPRGIGPQIIQEALDDPLIKNLANWKIFGQEKPSASPVEAGQISLKALQDAVKGIKNQEYDGLVTGPVSKTDLKLAGFSHPGQTEYLASEFNSPQTAMMLASPKLRVVLVTNHLSIKEVLKRLTSHLIQEKIEITHKALIKDFGITDPRIAVCGLNPHAGENGMFGNEEKELIIPAINKMQESHINAQGPFAADTVFYQALQGKFDAVICHYHDQGLIPLKTLAFDEGVNVTLGLPTIRTSPDHGPAFDIVGKGLANSSSMKAAMRMAVEMWKNRQTH